MEIERDVELGYVLVRRQIFRLAPVTIRSSAQLDVQNGNHNDRQPINQALREISADCKQLLFATFAEFLAPAAVSVQLRSMFVDTLTAIQPTRSS